MTYCTMSEHFNYISLLLCQELNGMRHMTKKKGNALFKDTVNTFTAIWCRIYG